MNSKEFSKLSIYQKINLLKKEGEHIGAREYPSHFIHLFTFKSFYIEVFIIKNLNQIQWIEIQSNKYVLELYVQKLDLKNILGDIL